MTFRKTPREAYAFAILQDTSADGSTVVQVVGEIDLATSPSLQVVLRDLAEQRSATMLDLSRTTFMECTGLAVVLGAACTSARGGWSFGLAPDPSSPVVRLLRDVCIGEDLASERIECKA